MTAELIRSFGWRDALDVLVVAAVVYRVFALFEGTRVAQMAGGLALLLAAALTARWLELSSTSWILDNFWAFWVVALIVLFQPELRRALAQAGRGRLLHRMLGTTRAERTHVIDDVVRAAESLAARRVGALIVFERSMGLRHYAELGVLLDALVSPDLLGSIFLPYSPLHDGAVFIQGDRVVAAGCFLPLSRNVQLSRTLGTRHRAALGISEESDGVALVVSEESGGISLAVEGKIETFRDAPALRQRLAELFGVGAPAERPGLLDSLRRRLFVHRVRPTER